jgi:hypothetical protein
VDENFEIEDIDEKIEQQGKNVLNMDCHPMCIKIVNKHSGSHRQLFQNQGQNRILFSEGIHGVRAQ